MDPDILITQDHHSLVFWPKTSIASLTPEYPGRLRVIAEDGSLSYLPGPAPAGPWVPLADSLVTPRLLRPHRNGWEDPGRFQYPPATLAEPELPARRLYQHLPCPPEEVISLLGEGQKCRWHTVNGDIPWNKTAAQAAGLHPHLFKLARGVYLNLLRLRRILKDRPKRTRSSYTFAMDTGERYPLNGVSEPLVAQRLGLTRLTYLDPYHPGLWRRKLRDWPYAIASASAEQLQADFHELDVLLANLAMQTFLWRGRGLPVRFGTSYRDSYYEPVKHTVYRAGLLRVGGFPCRPQAVEPARLFELWEDILLEMVKRDQLFTFQELGFEDEYEDDREIGRLHPEIVLVAEKESQGRLVRRLAREFGFSVTVTQGLPTLVANEFLARALRRVTDKEIRIIAVVDWDYGGWMIARIMVRHLIACGLLVRPPQWLMTPEAFSRAELELLAVPCQGKSPSQRTKNKQWTEATGGIFGQPLGLHINHLQPYERLRQALVDYLARF